MTAIPSVQPMTFFSAFRQRRTQRRGLQVALVVGTILNLINQGEIIVAGDFAQLNVLKSLLTYCVPYCVSTYSSATYALEAYREQARQNV